MDIIQKAKEFSHKAHAGQLLYQKKGSMMLHVEEVVDLVEKAQGSPEEIAAAWLHDVVEDTPVTLEEVRTEFGENVASVVDELTDPEHLAHNSQADRKQLQANRISSASSSAKLVKLADQASNCRLAGTEHRTWDIPTTLQYIDGARKVAQQCKGISPMLDDLFENYYQTTRQTLLEEAGREQF